MFTWEPSHTQARNPRSGEYGSGRHAQGHSSPGSKKGAEDDIWAVKKSTPTDFRRYYNRGDIPVSVEHTAYGNRLKWRVEITKLDYHHYLPLFFEGLRETQHPYSFVAEMGAKDMLEAGGQLVVPVIPQLILPIKQALDTHDPSVIVKVLRILQLLVEADVMAGPALVPYFRQILPVFNQYFNHNVNIGDHIYYGQRKNENIGDLINETLELFERKGGSDALINIKYMVPCYQSCLQ